MHIGTSPAPWIFSLVFLTCCGTTLKPGGSYVAADADVSSADSSVTDDGTTCPDAAVTCAADSECDDGLTCTTDHCSPCGACVHEPVEGECVVAGQCWKTGEGPQPCFRCDPSQSSTGLSFLTGKPCDDGDACTKDDLCDSGGQCKGVTNPDCCKDVPNCCTAGECCDIPNKTPKLAKTACGGVVLATEYICKADEIRKRDARQVCDGNNGACPTDPTWQAWGEWSVVQKCGAGEKCVPGAPGEKPECKTPGVGPCQVNADCEDFLPCSDAYCLNSACANQASPQGMRCGDQAVQVEYGCSGNVMQMREGFTACDGAGLLCDELGGPLAWGNWQSQQACPYGTTCEVAVPSMPGTCVNKPVTECSGTTCCQNGFYAPKGTKCGTSQLQKKYSCSGSGNGSDVMLTYAYGGCSGSSTSCSTSSSSLVWVTEKYKDCSSYQKCEVKNETWAGTCVTGDKCTPGTTCCPDGQYAAKGTKCGTYSTKKIYTCSGATKGATVYVQEVFNGCSGSSTTCSSSYPAYGPVTKYKTCSSSQYCKVTSSSGSCSSTP